LVRLFAANLADQVCCHYTGKYSGREALMPTWVDPVRQLMNFLGLLSIVGIWFLTVRIYAITPKPIRYSLIGWSVLVSLILFLILTVSSLLVLVFNFMKFDRIQGAFLSDLAFVPFTYYCLRSPPSRRSYLVAALFLLLVLVGLASILVAILMN